jgi:hypothetical protein
MNCVNHARGTGNIILLMMANKELIAVSSVGILPTPNRDYAFTYFYL